MNDTQPVNDPDYDTDVDLYPPDQASELGASYFYTEPAS
jgi:hypothetical protein